MLVSVTMVWPWSNKQNGNIFMALEQPLQEEGSFDLGDSDSEDSE